MGWARSISGRLARGCGRARHGSLIGHHRGKSMLNVFDGLGEGSVCGDEVVDGGILLNGRVDKVIQ